MRYLKTYEELSQDDAKLLKDFETKEEERYLRKGTEIIDEEVAQELLYDLEHFNGDDKPIFREMRISESPDEIFVIDPKKHSRMSANTPNFTTIIIDNSPYWKDYPKRSKSLICSILEPAKGYGQPYRVIPLDKDSKWGQCPQSDIWWSFELRQYEFDQLNDLNSFLFRISNDKNPKSLKELEDIFKELEQEIKDHGEMGFDENGKLVEYKLKIHYWEEDAVKILKEELKNKSLRETIQSWLKPDRFDLYTYDKLKGRGVAQRKEVWTDAKCMLVPTHYFDIDNNNSLVRKIEV